MTPTRLFPYFGSKARCADVVWRLLGDPDCYVEPFAGSLAVLLARPSGRGPMVEVVSDLDGLLTNFWRALRANPVGLVEAASDGPVNEVDLTVRHDDLLHLSAGLSERMLADPGYFSVTAAAWWWQGISSWLGSGYGIRPARQRPHIDRTLKGLWSLGMTDERVLAIAGRLAGVVILAGDWEDAWQRTITDSIVKRFGPERFGAFLDPPYTLATGRVDGLYSADDPLSGRVAVRMLELPSAARVVVAGYAEEYPTLIEAGWSVHRWNAPNGYAQDGNDRRSEEVLLASPGCVPVAQEALSLG